MIIIRNKVIPFGRFKAMAMWPFIFAKKLLTNKVKRHECIHGEQQLEMLMVGLLLTMTGCIVGMGWWSVLFVPLYFWWYIIEWLVRSAIAAVELPPTEKEHCWKEGYRNIAFEREAYFFESDETYLDRRKPFAWTWWLIKRY